MSCLKGGNCEHGGCSDCQDESNIKLGQDWLIKEGTKKMSIENIKTGLKLSEAIKLIEENEGALLSVHQADIFRKPNVFGLGVEHTYDVKLPQPKTVNVTRTDIERAWLKSKAPISYPVSMFEQFCKELGL